MSECYLEMKNICKSFAEVQVLNHINFNLKPGEVHVLLGENGAGKSTLIKIMSGAYTKASGEIFIEDRLVEINKPKDAFQYGIGVIYQEFNLNPYMSIYENIFLGKELTKRFGLIDKRKAIEETESICKKVGLTVSPKTLVKHLSVAQMQMVEIAKALSMNVKVLVLDEPTATLTDTEIAKLFEIIRELKDDGVGIVYISHRMKELTEIGDRCTVLRDGSYIGTVELKNVTCDELIHMMVGRNVDFEKRAVSYRRPERALKVEGIYYKGLLKDVSFELYKGEVLGVAGLVGSGRTELAKCIIGEYRKDAGRIFINNKEEKIKCPSDAISKRIVYLSEDRKNEGLILKHEIKSNTTLTALGKIQKNGLINNDRERSCVNNLISQFGIKTNSMNTYVKNLSGGNQQKVVIAKWVFCGADVYIIDEPTRGIDVGARQEIYNIMEELLKEGASIIMISSDLVEVLKMSDRVMVMCNGEKAAVLDNSINLTQENILEYAIGGKC
ncbi:sugar ABC transporter ATP-binding protein [Petroclostridium sp. X23]|uniref:sugar ABC transporter ATP-binding protein n=1 Tax=Petroclostridium sp. X23 TaxID=3045146 RepID=UPI0024AD889F|nr:sugar ABC transporter ATP-binding protein [Petroclostridium sp. X23]WHH58067.1 sugar ABC transporter ATP-binding protein [Petroclostridium sp. X23]